LRAVNEVEAEGYRIAGIGGGRIREASLVVGNFLFDFDFEMMAQVWHAPWEPFRELAASALKDRIATLSSLLEDVNMKQVEEILIEEYEISLSRQLVIGALIDEELQLGEKICERMGSEEYLSLHDDRNVIGSKQGLKIAAGVYVHALETEILGSYVQASFLVKDDIIQEAHLQSDSLPELHQLESGLRGVPFDNWQKLMPVAQ
jgi:hypothetical protein